MRSAAAARFHGAIGLLKFAQRIFRLTIQEFCCHHYSDPPIWTPSFGPVSATRDMGDPLLSLVALSLKKNKKLRGGG